MTSENTKSVDLAAIRARLTGARGLDYWRSLEQLAETPGFQELLDREFPGRRPSGLREIWLDDGIS